MLTATKLITLVLCTQTPATETATTPEAMQPAHAAARQESPPDAETDFYEDSDFIDTRVTFALSNVNIFAGPGERAGQTSGYRIGVDPNFNLFLENTNTRFSGFESLSHIVLYKRLPSWWKMWETEAALAVLVLADTDDASDRPRDRPGQVLFFDSGTYLRVIRKLDEGPEEKTGSFDLTAWPISADRFRLGYTYLISWGGTSIFPGKLQASSITEGAVPGIRLRYRGPEGKSYAFAGFKSALLRSRDAGVRAGEQVPNYGFLGGAGIDLFDSFVVETNGGYFQKGTQERPGLEGNSIHAYGVSGRVTFYSGSRPPDSADFQLYRNDPRAQAGYYLFKPYKPGTGFSVGLEATYLAQNLEDPDRFGSEEVVPALALGLVALAKFEELTLRLDGFFQSPNFILFNVPGFVPFQAVPDSAETTPEFFGSITGEYYFDDWKFRPSLSIGVKVPATYKGEVLADQGALISGTMPGDVRTQVIVNETERIILPPGVSTTPVIGAVLKLPVAISQSTALSAEARFELNDNQPRIAQDHELGQVTYFFDEPTRLSLALVLQSRW